jgi:hypothetical protein
LKLMLPSNRGTETGPTSRSLRFLTQTEA